MEPAGHRGLPRPPLHQLQLGVERRPHVQRAAAQIQVRADPAERRCVFRQMDTNVLPLYVCVCFCRPDLINMGAVTRQSNRENLEQAFEIAESLGVTRLLDAEGEAADRNRSSVNMTHFPESSQTYWR